MSVFAEILCKEFPYIKFPSINKYSLYALDESYKYNKLYYNAIQLIYNIYYLPYNKKYSKYNKFNILNNVILNNKYITDSEKEFFLLEFSKAQKRYSAFRNLAIMYRFKYANKFESDTDLCFNKFNQLNENILIQLFENKILYKFRISDLLNIINKALSNAPEFFADPCAIRNPYTNLPFSLANLYNIYFKLRTTNYIIPILFHQYFISNFDIEKFKNDNECIIRDKCIENFIKSDSIDEKYEYIMRMFYVYYNYIYFTLHPQFPKNILVNIFKDYLKLFLLREFSLNPSIRNKCNIQLQYKLALFSQLNPEFGKKIWVKKRRNNQDRLYYYFNISVNDSTNINYNNTVIPTFLHRSEINNNEENIYYEVNTDNYDEEQEEDEEDEEEDEEQEERNINLTI